jgi:hypothetical protein
LLFKIGLNVNSAFLKLNLITKMTQDYLSNNQQTIIRSIINQVGNKSNEFGADLILDIHFPSHPFFEKEGIKDFIQGFRCKIKTALTVNSIEPDKIFKYQNLTEQKTVAIIIQLKLDEHTKKFFNL